MDNADHQALVGHPGLIRPEHLQRLAVVYLRQSTPGQVQKHTGSTAAQRDLADVARKLADHGGRSQGQQRQTSPPLIREVLVNFSIVIMGMGSFPK